MIHQQWWKELHYWRTVAYLHSLQENAKRNSEGKLVRYLSTYANSRRNSRATDVTGFPKLLWSAWVAKDRAHFLWIYCYFTDTKSINECGVVPKVMNGISFKHSLNLLLNTLLRFQVISRQMDWDIYATCSM